MKKFLAVLLITVLLGTFLVGCGKEPASNSPQESAEEKPEVVKLRVAYHPNLFPLMIPGIGEEQGYFTEEGLDIEWIKFTSGPPEIAAMVSGDIQFGYIGHGAHTLCVEGEADVVSLSHLGNSEEIIVRKSSGISEIEDLKGKTIATQLGTSGEVILNLALKKAGLDKKDVKIVNMDMSGAVSAFIAGKVDAISCWDTYLTNIKDNVKEELLTLTSTADYADQVTFPASWVATPDYIEKNRDVVVRFVRALNKCYDYREANLDEAIRAAAKFGNMDYDMLVKEKDLALCFSSSDLKEFIENGKLLDIYQRQLDYFIQEGKVSDGDVNDYVRVDIMKEAFAE